MLNTDDPRLIFSILISLLFLSVDGYTNYTVGGSLGWYDSLQKPAVDYKKWAAGNNFTLGDFLIFNTDNNHSVIQTYNLTTYRLCDSSEALDNDTIEWSSADPSSTTTRPVTVAVPLVRVGPTYFFSGDYDGEQCENGQRLEIRVARGDGLPPEGFENPSDGGSPGPVGPESGDDESAPDTLVPSNFDHPIDASDGDGERGGRESSESACLVAFAEWWWWWLAMVGFSWFLGF